MLFKHNLLYGKFFSPDGDSGGGTGASGDGGEGDAGQNDGSDSGDGDSGDEGGDETSGLKTALEKERADRKKFEKDLKAAQKRLSDFENANKTDLEKITGERDDYKTRLDELAGKYREMLAETAFMDAAQKANALSPRLLFRAYRSELEYDDEGQVTNLQDVLKKAKADEPTLFKAAAGSGDGGKGGSGTDTSDMNALIRQKAGRR